MVDQNINLIAFLPNNGSISIFHYYLLNWKSRIIHIGSFFQEFMQHSFGLKIDKEQ